MSLNAGDLVEGIYQLEKKVFVDERGLSCRWLADDITAYRRSEVVIDAIPADYVTDLHWNVDGLNLRTAGQSADKGCRYMVWEKDQVPPPIEQYEIPELDDSTRAYLARLIDALPVSDQESLHTQEMPEFWHYGEKGTIVFYRKRTTQPTPDSLALEVKEQWKRSLFGTGPMDLSPKEFRQVDSPKASSHYWPLVLTLIGILLAVGVYSLRSQPDSKLESTSAARLLAFSEAFEGGIAYERKGAYPEAVLSFEKAVREAPASEMIDARLDSLAGAYTTYAQAECARYQSTGSKPLYFIPNQYYHYAAILSRDHTLMTCK